MVMVKRQLCLMMTDLLPFTEKDGSLVWDAGLASLLPSIAAGYYIFHGFNPPTARMDGRTMTYRVAAPLKPYEEPSVYTATGSNVRTSLGRRTLSRLWRSEESQKSPLL